MMEKVPFTSFLVGSPLLFLFVSVLNVKTQLKSGSTGFYRNSQPVLQGFGGGRGGEVATHQKQ